MLYLSESSLSMRSTVEPALTVKCLFNLPWRCPQFNFLSGAEEMFEPCLPCGCMDGNVKLHSRYLHSHRTYYRYCCICWSLIQTGEFIFSISWPLQHQSAIYFSCEIHTSQSLHFGIFTDEASGALHVILQNKTWKLAREYCQLNNMDLASARSWDENDAVEAVIYESRSSLSLFWIGLVKDMWEWSDQSNSSFRAWSTSQPNNDGQCTLYKPSDNTWFDRGCANNYPFYCYIGKHIFYSLILPCTTYTFLHYPESAILNTMNKTEGILDVMFYFHWFDCRQKERELQAGCEGGNDIKFTL